MVRRSRHSPRVVCEFCFVKSGLVGSMYCRCGHLSWVCVGSKKDSGEGENLRRVLIGNLLWEKSNGSRFTFASSFRMIGSSRIAQGIFDEATNHNIVALRRGWNGRRGVCLRGPTRRHPEHGHGDRRTARRHGAGRANCRAVADEYPSTYSNPDTNHPTANSVPSSHSNALSHAGSHQHSYPRANRNLNSHQ